MLLSDNVSLYCTRSNDANLQFSIIVPDETLSLFLSLSLSPSLFSLVVDRYTRARTVAVFSCGEHVFRDSL